MYIEIKETGKEERITCIDPKQGTDWSSDLIGNADPKNEGYNDDGIMIMTQVNFDWWFNYCSEYESADYAVNELLIEKDSHELTDYYHNLICGMEFNDIPEAMHNFVIAHN